MNKGVDEGVLDRNLGYIKNVQETVKLIKKKRNEYLLNKSKANKDKYKSTQELLAFDFNKENFSLGDDYTVIGSDFHGDFFSLYGFLVQSGYLIPSDDERCPYIIAIYQKGTDSQLETGYQTVNDKVCNIIIESLKEGTPYVVLPNFSVNKDFKARIELLGDIIDRGPESLRCTALLDYLTKLEKRQHGSSYDEKKLLYVHCGNHEAKLVSKQTPSLYRENNVINKLINQMQSDGRMVYSSIIKQKNNEYISFSHTSFCKSHIYKIMGIIAKFYDMLEKDWESEYEDKEGVLATIKTKFENTKTKNKYNSLFESLDKKLGDLKTKLETTRASLSKTFEDAKQELGLLPGEIQELDALASGVNKLLTECGKLSPLNRIVKKIEANKKEPYDLLKETLNLQDYDYYLLRDFIVEVIPPDYYVDNYKCIDAYFRNGDYLCCSDSDGFLNDVDGSYWFLTSRYSPTFKETFKSITQFVGHDPSKLACPYIKNKIEDGSNKSEEFNMGEHGRVLCVDSLLSVGFHEIKKKKRSESILLVRTPDGKYIVEKFSVLRNEKFEILPDELKMEQASINLNLGREEFSPIKKSKSVKETKRFYSFKRLLKAFYNIGLKNKNKESVIENNMELDLEPEEIVGTGEEKKLKSENMDPDKTLEYFKTKIEELVKGNDKRKKLISNDGFKKEDKEIQLTSGEISTILKDFDRKTNYKSLFYFLERCSVLSLSEGNFHKLIKYYNDRTDRELIFELGTALERDGGGDFKKNTLRQIKRDDIKKLLGEKLTGYLGTWEARLLLIHVENNDETIKKYMSIILSKIKNMKKSKSDIPFGNLHDITQIVCKRRILEWPAKAGFKLVSGLYPDSAVCLANLYTFCMTFRKQTINTEFADEVIPMLLKTFRERNNLESAYFQRPGSWLFGKEKLLEIVETFEEKAQGYVATELEKLNEEVRKAFLKGKSYDNDRGYNNKEDYGRGRGKKHYGDARHDKEESSEKMGYKRERSRDEEIRKENYYNDYDKKYGKRERYKEMKSDKGGKRPKSDQDKRRDYSNGRD